MQINRALQQQHCRGTNLWFKVKGHQTRQPKCLISQWTVSKHIVCRSRWHGTSNLLFYLHRWNWRAKTLKFQSSSNSKNSSHYSSAMSPWCQCLNKLANQFSSLPQALSAPSSQEVVDSKASPCIRSRPSSKVYSSSNLLSSKHLRHSKWGNHRRQSLNRKETNSCRNYSTASTASCSSTLSDKSFNSSSCLVGSAALCHRARHMLPTTSHPQSHSSTMAITQVLHKSISLNNNQFMSSNIIWLQ